MILSLKGNLPAQGRVFPYENSVNFPYRNRLATVYTRTGDVF